MYPQLAGLTLMLNDYSLITLRKRDLLPIMNWRNEQIDILRQNKILTKADQLKYYDSVVFPSFTDSKTRIILLSFLKGETCIGYGGLTNIEWKTKCAEVSFIADTARSQDKTKYETDFTTFLTLLKQFAFSRLRFNRLFTETYDIRPFHVSILEKNGFKLENRLPKHVLVKDQPVDALLHGIFQKDYNE